MVKEIEEIMRYYLLFYGEHVTIFIDKITASYYNKKKKGEPNMNHVLSAKQYTKESLEVLFNLTDDIKNNPQKYAKTLDSKIVATMFYEPSTRTRLSFETAVLRLGGKIISTENASANSSGKKGESLEDTVKILQGYADAIVIRHSSDTWPEEAAQIATVPIINGGAGKGEHPTQALLDVYTIREQRKTLDGVKVAILGDLLNGRTIHSLLRMVSLYDNVEVYGLSKECFALPEEYIEMLKERGIKYKKCTSFDEIPNDVDVMYHTRIQSERFEGDFGREEFIINKKVLNRFSDNTIILHPLPRNEEISTDIDDDPRAFYFKQAHNGLYVRMALFVQAFEK